MLFELMGRMGPGICSVDGGDDRPTVRGNLGGGYGVAHCNQWGICGIAV